MVRTRAPRSDMSGRRTSHARHRAPRPATRRLGTSGPSRFAAVGLIVLGLMAGSGEAERTVPVTVSGATLAAPTPSGPRPSAIARGTAARPPVPATGTARAGTPPSPAPTPRSEPTPTSTSTPTSVPTSSPTVTAPEPPGSPAPGPTVPPEPPTATPTVPPDIPGAGVPDGVTLIEHRGDIVVTQPGTVLENLDIHGFVSVRAPDVVIRSSVVRGGDTAVSRALVAVSGSGALTIEDSELVAEFPSPYIDGLRGQNFTARRVDIHGVIDAVRVTGVGNVLVEDSWLHDLLHYDEDPNWSGGPSHDDNIQVQGGSNITIRNNVITGSHNAALMVTHDISAVSGLTFTGNIVDDGACTVNIGASARSATGVSITANVFGLNMTAPGCAIAVPAGMTVDTTGNTYADGTPVRLTDGG